jgi:hypothetical protein
VLAGGFKGMVSSCMWLDGVMDVVGDVIPLDQYNWILEVI